MNLTDAAVVAKKVLGVPGDVVVLGLRQEDNAGVTTRIVIEGDVYSGIEEYDDPATGRKQRRVITHKFKLLWDGATWHHERAFPRY